MSEPIPTPAESPAESPVTEQTPAQKEEAYYRRQFEKSQRELERLRSDSDRSRAQIEEAQKEAGRLRLELLKRDLCAREGLPAGLAKYVNGEDEESLLAAIRQVRQDFPAQAPDERGVGLPTRPGKQSPGINPEALSPMQKIAMGLDHENNGG